ncbi:MAG: tetratricopeptide repeat protein [Epsilonproteobacteria bacterium]|nr:tetratricopeptide repeat protein [Campylobacterota bacterium]
MKRVILLIPFFLFAEVDPFNAGVNSGYGLTPTEKAIVKNKKDISSIKQQLSILKKDLKKIQLKLINYDEVINGVGLKLDAFKTVLNDLAEAKSDINVLKKEYNLTSSKIEAFSSKLQSLEENVTSLQQEVNNIKNSLKEITKIQNENFLYLRGSIEEILKRLKGKKTNLSPKEAMVKAKKYFYSGNISKAKELFLYTYSHKYLPATSAYYLGEIAYKQKRYKDALAYYKKSVELYPKKASFTPRLLYHTAICFEKLGDKKSAKLTLTKVAKEFKNSKYGNLAKKELEKLK